MARNDARTKTTEVHAHELDGEMIVGSSDGDLPLEGYDAVREATDELEEYDDEELIATVTHTSTDVISVTLEED